MTHKYTNKESGFTLVELAIVMIIIGLLIGGVLKGQQLIENAKTTALIRSINSYQAAFNSFQDTYDGVPGDLGNATSRVPGCGGLNAAGNWCRNGNGSSLIGDLVVPMTVKPGGYRTSSLLHGLPEPLQAWKHLALAGMISGIEANANPTDPAQLFEGVHIPSSPVRGQFEIYYEPGANFLPPGVQDVADSGHWVRMTNTALSTSVAPDAIGIFNFFTAAGEGTISPNQLRNVDTKIDDGVAPSGNVRGGAYGDPNTRCAENGFGNAGNYYPTDQKNCSIAYFKIDG